MQLALDSTRAVVAATAARARALVRWAVRTAPQVGQSMVEYAIVAAIVAVIALAGVRLIGGTVYNAFVHAEAQVDSASKEPAPTHP
jgi:Flp pilus assembly pilin Flp